VGEVVFVDDFGNLITNIAANQLGGPIRRLRVGRRVMRNGFSQVRAYGNAEAGSLVLLESSTGHLEVAVANGNAARDLSLQIGSPVALHWN
jgi:hypothetical protein